MIPTNLNEILYSNRPTHAIIVTAIIVLDSQPVIDKLILKFDAIASSDTLEQWNDPFNVSLGVAASVQQ